MFRHILTDLNLAPNKPTPIYNDNRGAVEWLNSFSTKGTCHLNIHENVVREAQHLQEVFISHIPGTCNPADIFTKDFKSDCTFWSLRPSLKYFENKTGPPFRFCFQNFMHHKFQFENEMGSPFRSPKTKTKRGPHFVFVFG
jgi:hypothetical protein